MKDKIASFQKCFSGRNLSPTLWSANTGVHVEPCKDVGKNSGPRSAESLSSVPVQLTLPVRSSLRSAPTSAPPPLPFSFPFLPLRLPLPSLTFPSLSLPCPLHHPLPTLPTHAWTKVSAAVGQPYNRSLYR